MSDDVRLAVGLRRHRKINRLRRRLGGDGCWALMCLWMFAGEAHWDGDLAGLSDEDIEEEAGWEGAPGALVAVLLDPSIGFLEGEPGLRRIHDWAEHQPFVAGRGERSEGAKRAANARWERHRQAKEAAGSAPDPDAERMRGALRNDADAQNRNAPCPSLPNPPSIPPPIDPRVPAVAADAPALQGVLEGHAAPARTPANPAAPFAIALNHAGFRATPLNPELVAYVREGGTVDHLLAIAAWPECQGKPATYLLRIARRELSERAPDVVAVPTTTTTNGRTSAPSKQAQGLAALEGLKRESRLADGRNRGGAAGAGVPRPALDPGE